MKKKPVKKAKRAGKNKPVVKVKTFINKKALANPFGLTPLRDRVVIRPISADEGKQTASGIIIPETVDKERPERGEVVAVGTGKYDDGQLIPLTVKVGDVVVFAKYGFEEVKLNGQEFYILKEENILAVVK